MSIRRKSASPALQYRINSPVILLFVSCRRDERMTSQPVARASILSTVSMLEEPSFFHSANPHPNEHMLLKQPHHTYSCQTIAVIHRLKLSFGESTVGETVLNRSPYCFDILFNQIIASSWTRSVQSNVTGLCGARSRKVLFFFMNTDDVWYN